MKTISTSSSSTSLHGSWLWLARIGWLALVGIAAGLFISGIPQRADDMRNKYQPTIGADVHLSVGALVMSPWWGYPADQAGILDGDLVAVHRTPEVRNRQIIVARLENEVTVKRYKQDGSVVWLLPENTDFEPIKVNIKEDPLIIEGVVVGVLRRGKAMAA